ncbi:hypothetical protein QZH41_011576 [Actinostola sp. cb2023]|nr:hypothetical protein QZH41_011576 [Actinostola sp. cb2023]
MNKGYTTFGVQNGGECWSGAEAGRTYSKLGKAKHNCRNGLGGAWANDVYQMVDILGLLKKLQNGFGKLKKSFTSKDAKIKRLQNQLNALGPKSNALQASLAKLNTRLGSLHVSCIKKSTAWTEYALANIVYLDRHHLFCPDPYFLSDFVLKRSGKKIKLEPIHYEYRCCKVVL